MANTFTADFPDIRAKEQQIVFYKTNVAMKIADTSFRSQLSKGDVLNRPYRSSNYVQSYTRGTSITINDKTDTNEYLTVNRQFADGFYIDNFDKIQSNYDLIADYAKDGAALLSNIIDADVLGEALNATSVVDDGTLGGTSGNGIALQTSNILTILSNVKKALKKLNVSSDNLYGVISPEFELVLTEYIAGRDTSGGDTVGENGYVGKYFGIKFYVSNQLTSTAVLSLVTNPSNTNTMVIGGVTFTFVSSIGTTAGNILIGADVDTTRASAATLINAPSTTTATGVALSTENAKLFANQFSAVNSNSADTLTITAKGVGVLDVSETLTDGTDTWTAATQIQHNLFGVVGSPTLVIQADPEVQLRDVETKLGKNVLNGVLYGVKTFIDNAKQMVDIKVRCDSRNA